MLKSADNNTTLIISKDGGGTQVDILVKSPHVIKNHKIHNVIFIVYR